MDESSHSEILSDLSCTSTPTQLVQALRQLKNEVIGHDHQKQEWVKRGVLALLVRVLSDGRAGLGISTAENSDRDWTPAQELTFTTADFEDARLQAVIIIGSLANGAHNFILDISRPHVIDSILPLLLPTNNSHHIVLYALQALYNIAETVCLVTAGHTQALADFDDLIYVKDVLLSFKLILSQPAETPFVLQQCTLVASLISLTCQEERQRSILFRAGIVDILAEHLGGWILTTFSIHPTAFGDQRPRALTQNRIKLSWLLNAIGCVLQGAPPARTLCLLESEPIRNAWIKLGHQLSSSLDHVTKALPYEHQIRSSRLPTLAETILPSIVSTASRRAVDYASGFPPLDPLGVGSLRSQWPRTAGSIGEDAVVQKDEGSGESARDLFAWLIHVTRLMDDHTSLMAIRLFAILYSSHASGGWHDSLLIYLVIPKLVYMLDRDLSTPHKSALEIKEFKEQDFIVEEEAPAVLAMLTVNKPDMQRAAVDAGAIGKLSQLFKSTYNHIDRGALHSMWTPASRRTPQGRNNMPISPDMAFTARHISRVRETSLTAFAALASTKDEYRKAVIEMGIVPFVVRALDVKNVAASNAVPTALNKMNALTTGSTYANGREAILAACGAARALSRSVSTLRTNLMDAGLTLPLFELLQSDDMGLQIAATAVICNLVLEFSPMKDAVLDGGILKILCDHAHSSNMHLRLNSIWALKHLVVNSAPSVKLECLAHLDAKWLRLVINGHQEADAKDMHDDETMTSAHLSTQNAAGEQVNLLNVPDEMPGVTDPITHDVQAYDGGSTKPTDSMKTHLPLSRSPSRSHAVSHKSEHSFLSGTIYLPDEAAVVREGLEFIRNLMMGNDASQMIDHLLSEFGRDEFFHIISTKLRSEVTPTEAEEGRQEFLPNIHLGSQTPSDIMKSACYILVHIAASHPGHRELLISRSSLLELLVPIFHHPEAEIRACCAWIVINLTWIEDESDKTACRQRARQLYNLGFGDLLEAMQEDTELNCRDRAKNAMQSMSNALKA